MDLLTPSTVYDFVQPATVQTKRGALALFDGPLVRGIEVPSPVLLAPPSFNPLVKVPSLGGSGDVGRSTQPCPDGLICATHLPDVNAGLRGSNEETLGIAATNEPVGAGTFTGPRGGNKSLVALFFGIVAFSVIARRIVGQGA